MAAAMEFSEIKSYCEQYKEKFGSDFFSICATINGYHHYKVRPLIGFEMILQCIREPENRYDGNAIQVRVPVLRELRDVSDVVVRSFGGNQQTVKDIAGKTAGRVPAVLAGTLAPFLDNGDLKKISCIYTGTLRHGSSLIGEGPKLNCIYFVHCDDIGRIRQSISYQHEFSIHVELSGTHVVIF